MELDVPAFDGASMFGNRKMMLKPAQRDDERA
jgi:hypothetical protein